MDYNQSQVALALPDGLPFDEWRSMGQALASQHRNITWLAGDWFNFGKAHYGEQAVLDLPEFGDGIQKLKTLAKVAEVFPPSERDSGLSFKHYMHLVDLPHGHAKEIIAKAKAEKLLPSAVRIEKIRTKVELGQGDFVEDDVEHQELVAMQRVWNRSSRSARSNFLQLANESNLGPIDG